MQFLQPCLDDAQVLHDVVFAWRQPIDKFEAAVRLREASALHEHHAEVVQALDVGRLQVQDSLVALKWGGDGIRQWNAIPRATHVFGCIQVLDAVHVDVSQQDVGLDVVRIEAHQLVEERGGL